MPPNGKKQLLFFEIELHRPPPLEIEINKPPPREREIWFSQKQIKILERHGIDILDLIRDED